MITTKDGVTPDRISIGDTLYIILPDEQLPEGWFISQETVADVSRLGYYRGAEDEIGSFSPLDGGHTYEIYWNQAAAEDRLSQRIADHAAGLDYHDPHMHPKDD